MSVNNTVYQELFKFRGDDFEVCKLTRKLSKSEFTQYCISIEGYIGGETLRDIIDLYKDFQETFYTYLIENEYEKTDKTPLESFYRSREIAVAYWADCFWVFTNEYRDHEIWDLYYYIEDVIEQLVKLNEDIKSGIVQVKNEREGLSE